MKINHVMGSTNWHLLAHQKLALITLLRSHRLTATERVPLDGLLHWIDAIQDAAEIDGFPVVFLEENG